MGKDEIILVNLSGRGDKDVQQVAAMIEAKSSTDGKFQPLPASTPAVGK